MKNTILKLAFLTLSISLLTSCKTKAQEKGSRPEGNQPPTVEETFKTMDEDEDGKLSKEEVKGPLKNDFAKIDMDEDGFITKEELEKAPKPKRPEGGPNRQ